MGAGQIFDEEPFWDPAIANYAARSHLLGRLDHSTSTVNIPSGKSIKIYPNPTLGRFNIINEDEKVSEIDLQMFALNDRRILSVLDYNFESIDLSDQPSGTYILRYISKGQTKIEKLIKI